MWKDRILDLLKYLNCGNEVLHWLVARLLWLILDDKSTLNELPKHKNIGEVLMQKKILKLIMKNELWSYIWVVPGKVCCPRWGVWLYLLLEGASLMQEIKKVVVTMPTCSHMGSLEETYWTSFQKSLRGLISVWECVLFFVASWFKMITLFLAILLSLFVVGRFSFHMKTTSGFY